MNRCWCGCTASALTGDVFGSQRCDCGAQLAEAMRIVERAGAGAVLYMRQEGRGIGLANKLRAYALQDVRLRHGGGQPGAGLPARTCATTASRRRCSIDLGVRRMRLLTNNPKKVVGLEGYGLEMVERVPLEVPPTEANKSYLETKKHKLGHLLSSL
ncbi:MAG: hypothetical protein KatS3mg102_0255 [Planctomycetota bacterium]|nr:MAG: hypothetical protein KatS3mg102_0255 [Planctomycetota bacterium]